MPVPLIQPFAAIRPAKDAAQDVVAPPYDVLSSDEAREMARGNLNSFLHVSKAEIDLAPDIDPYAPDVYAKAAANMQALLDKGVLKRDAKPCYYAYRMIMGDHKQIGLVAAGSVEAYDANRIRKHEFTRPAKEDDRVRQIEAVGAHTGPVLTAHRPNADVAAILDAASKGEPASDVIGPGKVRHTIWIIDDAQAIKRLTEAFDGMNAIYIADGHHRSAAASRVAAAHKAKNPKHSGHELYNRFLIVSFPEDQMRILDYNRVVQDLAGLSPDAFLKAVAEKFEMTKKDGEAKPAKAATFGMYLGGAWYLLTPREPLPPKSDPVGRLDVSVIYDRLLAPILKIGDQRRDSRIDFVGGIRGLAELKKRVDSGEMAVAFALHPTSMADLLAVADAGEVMPPKSTWFEPKLTDGLVSLPLE
jgi:uncharacterized protein (DUF1015 family)